MAQTKTDVSNSSNESLSFAVSRLSVNSITHSGPSTRSLQLENCLKNNVKNSRKNFLGSLSNDNDDAENDA